MLMFVDVYPRNPFFLLRLQPQLLVEEVSPSCIRIHGVVFKMNKINVDEGCKKCFFLIWGWKVLFRGSFTSWPDCLHHGDA